MHEHNVKFKSVSIEGWMDFEEIEYVFKVLSVAVAFYYITQEILSTQNRFMFLSNNVLTVCNLHILMYCTYVCK